ncbi:hypothetical protein ACFLTJ_00300 [Chloroflexota bacterium]
MGYPDEIVIRALELYKGRSADKAVELLKKELLHRNKASGIEKYTQSDFPSGRTVRTWRQTNRGDKLQAKNKDYTKDEIQKEQKSEIAPPWHEHYNKLAELATEMLGGLSNLQALGENTFRCYGLEGQPGYNSKVLTRKKLIEWLHLNMIATRNQNLTLMNSFRSHLSAEKPRYKNLYKCLEKSPEKYFRLLQKVAFRKTFKGKCEICEDW